MEGGRWKVEGKTLNIKEISFFFILEKRRFKPEFLAKNYQLVKNQEEGRSKKEKDGRWKMEGGRWKVES